MSPTKRHGIIGAAIAAPFLLIFWIAIPSGHGERAPLPVVSEVEDAQIAPARGNAQVASRVETAVTETKPAKITAAPRPDVRRLTVAPGDTLMALLVKAGMARAQAHGAITALSKIYNPRDLKPGVRVTVTRRPADPDKPSENQSRVRQIDLAIDPKRDISVRRDAAGGFVAQAVDRPLATRSVRAGGVIDSSLYLAGRRAKVPADVLARLIRVFSFDVDFQRDVQPGDSFDLMYEGLYDESGAMVAEGAIQIAEMTLSGKRIRLYRHRTGDGETDFFDARGRSVRKALTLTPIDGARISSGYGRRRHPILGYNKMHRGTDFAAPSGTPVFAAGRGVLEMAGRNGAYGRYIRIRHNATFKTAYAHLKGYARGIRRGKRVRQGQIIGYVGSSGRSTGPHLHYEILRNGKRINPKRLNLPSGRTLAGTELKYFLTARAILERRYATLPANTQLAVGKNK